MTDLFQTDQTSDAAAPTEPPADNSDAQQITRDDVSAREDAPDTIERTAPALRTKLAAAAVAAFTRTVRAAIESLTGAHTTLELLAAQDTIVAAQADAGDALAAALDDDDTSTDASTDAAAVDAPASGKGKGKGKKAKAPKPVAPPTQPLHLYELVSELRTLDHFVDEADGEWTPEIEALSDELAPAIMAKSDNSAGYLRSLELSAELCKQESRRQAARGKAFENKAERFKRYLDIQLARAKREELAGTFFTIRRQFSAWRAQVSVPVSELPAAFVIHPEPPPPPEPRADLDALLDALNAGAEIPGVEKVRTSYVRVYG